MGFGGNNNSKFEKQKKNIYVFAKPIFEVFSKLFICQETILFNPNISAASYRLLQRSECYGRVT